MGNQPTSTRRVTFEREQTGLIAISDSVAKRLRSGENPESSDEARHYRAPEPAGSPGSRSSTTNSTMGSTAQDFSLPALEEPLPSSHNILSHGSEDDRISSLQKLQEEWQNRYKRLESDVEHMKKTYSDEFERSIEHAEGFLARKTFNVANADLQKAVMDCYKQNTTRPLHCSKEADAFIISIDNYKRVFLGTQVA